MVTIRVAEVTDILEMQHCNLFNLPENYNLRYWNYHLASWPDLPHVAVEEATGKIVGYVLAKMEDDDVGHKGAPSGHITSISVLRDYRKLGLAAKLMRATHFNMQTIYGAHRCSLNVRVSNFAAIGLYRDVLGYSIEKENSAYYADKEDSFFMRIQFKKDPVALPVEESKEEPKSQLSLGSASTTPSLMPSPSPAPEETDDAPKKKKKNNKKKKGKKDDQQQE